MSRISKATIDRYGIQTYRDNLSNRNGLESNAECNAYVAQACGEIGQSAKSLIAFAARILERAKKSSKEECEQEFKNALASIGKRKNPTRR